MHQDWSPEQVSGWLSKRHIRVSHKRIYQYVYADKRMGGDLHHHLCYRKKRRKRYGSYKRRGQLIGRRSISERPQAVAQTRRIGDWEADTIIGQNQQQAIVSVVERKSKLTLLKKVARRTAEAVEQALAELLKPLQERCHTITSDNEGVRLPSRDCLETASRLLLCSPVC